MLAVALVRLAGVLEERPLLSMSLQASLDLVTVSIVQSVMAPAM